MMKLALVFVAALALGVDGQTTKYLADCTSHLMKFPTVGPACKPLITSGVSAADRETILFVHNAQRSRVALGNETLGAPGPQPQAANMLMMQWNNELANIAQRWSKQCIFPKDNCRKVPESSIGQNIYQSTSTTNESTANWNETINIWQKEVALYNKTSVNSYVFSATTGNYTQIVWGDTSLVGCGFSHFKNIDSTYTKKLYVCNYGPGGNTAGSKVYAIGTPCSKCPRGTVCSNGLCQRK